MSEQEEIVAHAWIEEEPEATQYCVEQFGSNIAFAGCVLTMGSSLIILIMNELNPLPLITGIIGCVVAFRGLKISIREATASLKDRKGYSIQSDD